MEKKRPTYDLASFKAAFSPGKANQALVTLSALQGARQLGFGFEKMLVALQALERRHFFKSMTSYHDHTVWQDVYHLPYGGLLIYVKFVADLVTEFRLLSFKEK
ncbi:type II toxin-antitoxin system MqsR family toxin [Myxococcota bacterium]